VTGRSEQGSRYYSKDNEDLRKIEEVVERRYQGEEKEA
jgi:hypothetical protein